MTISLKTLGIGSGGLVGTGGLFTAGWYTGDSNDQGELIIEDPDYQNGEYTKTLGYTVAKYTTNAEWMFLYLLSDKVFNYLKINSKHGDKNDLISWIKSKLNSDSESSDDSNLQDWEKFRNICTKALETEDEYQDGTIKSTPEIRLCFMGFWERSNSKLGNHIDLLRSSGIKKGALKNWNADKNSSTDSTQPYKDLEAFKENNWNRTNSSFCLAFLKSKHGGDIEDNTTDFNNYKKQFELWFNDESTVSIYRIGSYNPTNKVKLADILNTKK